MSVLVVLGIAGPGTAAAHDSWILFASHSVEREAIVDLRYFNGHGDERTEYAYSPDSFVRFELHGPSGMLALEGFPGVKPFARVRFEDEGIFTVAYQSRHMFIELPPERFEPYLKAEGLDDILTERKRRGEENLPGTESYARYLKTLIQVGDGNSGFDRKVGLPLEITALTSPFAAVEGHPLTFVLEHEGEPVVGAHVELVSVADLHRKVTGTTDEQGEIAFRVPMAGRWMVAATYMRRSSEELEGDWESFWASLTFEVR